MEREIFGDMVRTFHGCSCRGERDTFFSFGILPQFAYLCPNKKNRKTL